MNLSYTFRDPALLQRALTHRSWAAEHTGEYNESLEFLGDSVLQLLATELLLRRHPDWDEGLLSKGRQKLVCQAALVGLADEFGLGAAVRLGRGEQRDRDSRGDKPRILADTFEALLGALFLDGGYPLVVEIVGPSVDARVQSLDIADLLDPKSRLQELLQRKGKRPRYDVPIATGPANELRFQVWVEIEGSRFGPGEGRTRGDAEQAAARIALSALTEHHP